MYKTGETTGETQEPIAVVGLDVSVGDIGFTWPGAGSRILKRRCRHNIGRSARETLAVNTGGCCAGGGHSGEMCPIIVSRMHIAGRHKARSSAGGGHSGGVYPKVEGGMRIAGWRKARKVAEETRIM